MHNGLCESSCLKELNLHRPFPAHLIPSFVLIRHANAKRQGRRNCERRNLWCSPSLPWANVMSCRTTWLNIAQKATPNVSNISWHPWQVFCKWAICIVLGCVFVASSSETSPSTASSMTFKHPKKLHSEHRWTNQGWAPLQKKNLYCIGASVCSHRCHMFLQRIKQRLPTRQNCACHTTYRRLYLLMTTPASHHHSSWIFLRGSPANLSRCLHWALTACCGAFWTIYHLFSLAALTSQGDTSRRISTILASSTNNSCSANTGA